MFYYPVCVTMQNDEYSDSIINSNDRKVFPNLEEHDSAELKFDLLLDPNKHEGSKNNWYYSATLNKVYICLDKPSYIDIRYLPKLEEQLYLRLMIVYIDDIGSPVLRCMNHLYKDKTQNDREKHSVVRCGNNDVTYIGTAEGKNCEDRLALLVKLNNVQPDENLLCKQSIKLTFVCQNSCIGRKQTALIFTLETSTQILGKKIVNVKVCSCPKRDKQKDEENFLHMHMPPMPSIKILENGSVQMELVMPNIHIACKLLEHAFNSIAGEMINDNNESKKYEKYLRDLKKSIDNLPS